MGAGEGGRSEAGQERDGARRFLAAGKKEGSAPAAAPPVKKKLSYLEAREWEKMESRILQAEQEREAIHAEMHSPEVVSDGPRLQSCYARLQAADAVIHELYVRWAELEAKQQS